MSDGKELPKYKCHKEVWALKIKSIRVIREGSELVGIEITPEEEGYKPFTMGRAYALRHEPKVGGYFVWYEDGYKSYSPAKSFEAGYTLIEKK